MSDFIERYFRVAPDNGDGSIEFFLGMFLIVLIVAIVLRLFNTTNRPQLTARGDSRRNGQHASPVRFFPTVAAQIRARPRTHQRPNSAFHGVSKRKPSQLRADRAAQNGDNYPGSR
jgi:hypothetical protein